MKILTAGSERGDQFSARVSEGGDDHVPATEGYTLTFALCRTRQRHADMRNIVRETFAVVSDLEGLRFLYTQLGRFLNE